ncbi:external alternative NAD(P)H-ubiquinoneoxidoreductase B1 [Striga asiatica]|uniref:External alternative NAD(P)H-ubiquinoneoxidoreductase B1 n=1 Tax=Striga asiatica TaxID=4170 RepID=A0A5A7P7K8_STRAF|nr:external alternative NAD(P)H-ubiquinoneoxidoreductase B1 [Striga asiatica]
MGHVWDTMMAVTRNNKSYMKLRPVNVFEKFDAEYNNFLEIVFNDEEAGRIIGMIHYVNIPKFLDFIEEGKSSTSVACSMGLSHSDSRSRKSSLAVSARGLADDGSLASAACWARVSQAPSCAQRRQVAGDCAWSSRQGSLGRRSRPAGESAGIEVSRGPPRCLARWDSLASAGSRVFSCGRGLWLASECQVLPGLGSLSPVRLFVASAEFRGSWLSRIT